MIAAEDLLGIGLYSTSEAALYARVRTQLVANWMHGTAVNKAVIEPELGADEKKIVTFLDFIQTLAIRRIRNETRLSLQKIRNGYTKAREEYGVKFPFAVKTTRIGLFGPPANPQKQEVFVCLNATNDDEVKKYFQLTGKKHGNQLIGEVVMSYARFIDFSPYTGLACRYVSYKSDDGRVLMDPELHFGEPFIESCGYAAYTLFNAYQTELSVERAAKIHNVEPRDIRLAIDYFDYLNPVAA
jgi:uncharacterized protein (DUF433 family)